MKQISEFIFTGLEVFSHRKSVYLIAEQPVWRLAPDDARRLAASLVRFADEAGQEEVNEASHDLD